MEENKDYKRISGCCKEPVEKIKVNKDHLVEGINIKYFYVCSNCGQEVEE